MISVTALAHNRCTSGVSWQPPAHVRPSAVSRLTTLEVTVTGNGGAQGLAQQVLLLAKDEAAAIRAAAERDAAEIRRRASYQATALIEDAERDAGQMRAAVLAMSAELSQVAAYVTDHLAGTATTVAVPPRGAVVPREPGPITSPEPLPTPRTDSVPVQPAQPDSTRRTRPRQYVAMRRVVVAFAAMMLLAVTAGATEVGMHGYPFFVFRSAGTGATSANGLQEDQGPGQPDAPRAHRQSHPAHKRPVASCKAPRDPKPSASAGGSHD